MSGRILDGVRSDPSMTAQPEGYPMKNMTLRDIGFRTLVLGAVLAATAACSSTSGRSSPGDGFPDPGRSTIAGGSYANLDNLRQVAPGVSKRQLYGLLGTPHFNEGLWGVREWNYLLNLRPDAGADPLTCQLRITFDNDGLATAFHWKPDSCARLIQPPATPPPAAAPAPTAALPSAPLRLSADALFDFDSDVLTTGGRGNVSEIVSMVRRASAVQDVVVVGYTDRIGTDAYNLDLSRRRAYAVRDFLVERGVPAQAIRAEGKGSAEPLVDCPSSQSREQLILCLAPNRRVEISGTVQR